MSHKPLLLDCRQGWEVKNFRVQGWRPQTVLTQLHGIEPSESQVKTFAQQYPIGQPVILDIEHWAIPEDQDKLIQVVDWWRDERPELRIGYYGLLPKVGYWPSVIKGPVLENWKQFNAAMGMRRDSRGRFASRGLVDVVDFICPCLYSWYPNTGTWDHEAIWFSDYAPAMIDASRAYQKQVYPFIWQRIHDEAGKFDQLLPDEHFRAQVQYCIDNADGVCIWDWADENTGTGVLERTSNIMREFV